MLAILHSVHHPATHRLIGLKTLFPRLSLVQCLTSSSDSQQQSSLLLKKQCRTPFIIFSADKLSEVRKSNPGSRFGDLSKMLGQMWKVLPEEQKEVYKLRYQDEKEVFLAKKKAQLDSMTEAEKSQLKEEQELRKKRSAARIDRKLKKRLAKPVATDVNPFILFCKSKVLERGDAPISQYIKGVSEHWKRMPTEDKQPYIEKAKSNSILYQQKLSAWEHKMVIEGHSSLLRRSALRKLTRRRNVSKVTSPAKKSMKRKSGNISAATEDKTSAGKPTGKSAGKTAGVDKPASSADMERGTTNKLKDKKQNK